MIRPVGSLPMWLSGFGFFVCCLRPCDNNWSLLSPSKRCQETQSHIEAASLVASIGGISLTYSHYKITGPLLLIKFYTWWMFHETCWWIRVEGPADSKVHVETRMTQVWVIPKPSRSKSLSLIFSDSIYHIIRLLQYVILNIGYIPLGTSNQVSHECVRRKVLWS